MSNQIQEVQSTAPAAAAAGILRSRLNRRRFLQTAGIAAGAAATLGIAGCDGVIGVDASTGPAPTPLEVLQFALNLEYFEASFYSYVVTGQGIGAENMTTSASPTPAPVLGFPKINFAVPAVAALANQLYEDELAHVRYLRAGIGYSGQAPVACPALNLVALGQPANDAEFLAIARALETVGTSAYEGAIQYLATNLGALTVAAEIHETEGQHEAALRIACISLNVSSPPVDGYDRPPLLGPDTIFNTSVITGLNTARNASEVLQIVYGAPGQTGVSSGGFYPLGFNGAVHTT